MSYSFYLDGTELPLAPSSLKINIKDKDEVIELMDGRDFTVLKSPGLSEFTMTFALPVAALPFASGGTAGFRGPEHYTNKLKELKTAKRPFVFSVARRVGSRRLFDTSIKVTVADWEMEENREAYGGDVSVTLVLREWLGAATQVGEVVTDERGESVIRYAAKSDGLPGDAAELYQVKEGDTLWKIAKAKYDDGAVYETLQELNGGMDISPNYLELESWLKLPSKIELEARRASSEVHETLQEYAGGFMPSVFSLEGR